MRVTNKLRPQVSYRVRWFFRQKRCKLPAFEGSFEEHLDDLRLELVSQLTIQIIHYFAIESATSRAQRDEAFLDDISNLAATTRSMNRNSLELIICIEVRVRGFY